MNFPFPLLQRREGDRHYYDTASSLHHYSLDIPESTAGRVRLQLTIPWMSVRTGGRHLLPLVIMWPKVGAALPKPIDLARVILNQLTTATFARSQRSSLVGELVIAPIRFKKWRAEILIPRNESQISKLLSTDDDGRDAAFACLNEGLAWSFRFFHGRWPRDQDKSLWIYRAHRSTALFVADEVAKLYLTNSKNLWLRKYLENADQELRKRIKAAYAHATITPRRLAIALVDVKFEKLVKPLLDPDRSVGLDDATLWHRFLMPPEHRSRLQALLPSPSICIHELRQLPKAIRENDERVGGFLMWWSLLVHDPLSPLLPPFPPEQNIRSRREIAFLELPGVERWASIVWEALNS